MRSAVALLFLAACATFPDVLRVDRKGSAVPLTDEWILTAKHLQPVKTVGGAPVLEAVPHPSKDLLLLRVPRAVRRCARIAKNRPKLGDKLFSMGYHLMDGLLVTEGRQGARPWAMTAQVIFGASGGPVLDANMKLVGVNSMVTLFAGRPVPYMSRYEPLDRAWIRRVIR